MNQPIRAAGSVQDPAAPILGTLFRTLAAIALISTAMASCAPRSTLEASYSGSAFATCSPVDASAYQFELTKTAGDGPERIQLQLWDPRLLSDGGSVRLSGEWDSGTLWSCDAQGDCVQLEQALLDIETVRGQAVILGSLRWQESSAIHQADFSAQIRPADPAPICG